MILQALSLAEQERSALQERLSSAQRDAESSEVEYDRQKRELLSRIDRYQASVDGLQNELSNVRSSLNEATCVFSLNFFFTISCRSD
jgi:chromosome segregation ATPase